MVFTEVNLLVLFSGQLGNMEGRRFFTLLALHVSGRLDTKKSLMETYS